MEIKKEKTLNIKLEGENVDTFTNAVGKIVAEIKHTGYSRSSMNEKELKLIEEINKEITK